MVESGGTTEEPQMDTGWEFVAGAGPCSNRPGVLVFQIPFKPLRQAPFSPIRRMPDGLAVALAWKWGPFVVFSRGSAAPRLGPGLLEFTCIHLPLGVGDRRVTQGPRLVLSLI